MSFSDLVIDHHVKKALKGKSILRLILWPENIEG